MFLNMLEGILIPLAGTTLGAAGVFFLKDTVSEKTEKILIGFAAGIMMAASYFSLLAPALDAGSLWEVTAGFMSGMGFLLVLDVVVPHIHMDESEEGMPSGLSRVSRMLLAVTLHNIPEGMAVGVVFTDWYHGLDTTLSAAMALSLGIALQNIPEGAIVAMPLKTQTTKNKAFLYGILSGAVEPAGALLIVFASKVFLPMMPFLLAFAAGAMIYVINEEMAPSLSKGSHTNMASVCFACGFSTMMVLDVWLG